MERELQGTAQSRDAALAMWTLVYQGVADIITGLLELAGFPHIADRVRPTWKRRSGIAEETDTEDTGGGGTGGPGGGGTG